MGSIQGCRDLKRIGNKDFALFGVGNQMIFSGKRCFCACRSVASSVIPCRAVGRRLVRLGKVGAIDRTGKSCC